MLVTISGMQTYSADPPKPAPPFPPPIAKEKRHRQRILSAQELEGLPRVFSHTFVLSPMRENVDQFRIVSENFRFVG